MKRTILFLFTFFCINVDGQTWEWVKSAGGTEWNVAYDIITDDAGNSYVSGGYYDTATFGNYQLTGAGYMIYVAKYSPSGNVIWARTAGGNGEDYGIDLCFDHLGGLYLAGVFTDSAFFGNDTLVTSSGVFDAFIARYDTAGNFLWVRQCGEPNYDQWANGVSADQWGNAYMAGMFSGNADFGSLQMNAIGNQDMFLVKFTPAGNAVWARQAGGPFVSGAGPDGDIVTDANGNSFIAGGFGGTVTWGSITLTSGTFNAYVARYDSSGNCLWVRQGGGNGTDGANGITMDKQENVFITGEFRDTAVFGNDSVISHGAADIFVAKCDSSGNELWVRDAGDASGDYGNAVTADTLGNCYATGMFLNSAYFDTVAVNGFGANDLYVAKYDAGGNLLWVKDAGSSGSDRGTGISHDHNGNIYVTGDYAFAATFDTIAAPGDPWVPMVYVGKIAPDQVPLGVEDDDGENAFSLYPNPCDGNVNFGYRLSGSERGELQIYDLTGQLVKRYVLSPGQNVLPLHEVAVESGIYFCRYVVDGKMVESGKLAIVK